ncbi:MAG TPA: TonB-dependent receptor [Ignavibacteriaceae bacterium]|nr:TonB-dependent receptor [Ignavibacteriaceae bacterium]
MKYLVILFFFLNISAFSQNLSIIGKVLDSETLQPLPAANLIILDRNIGTSTIEDGSFVLSGDIIPDDILKATYVGYSTKLIPLKDEDLTNLIIKLTPQIIPSQTVFVEGSIGKKGITPVTFEKIDRKEIEENYTIQDIPKYLSSLPSTTFYSENGNGIGYNYLSIRGFDQRRISVSINGIPQNDPEDHNVYWLDFPDLLASTELIQVQRGAGNGASGYPAIGGSINIITSSFTNDPQTDFFAAVGSYNTRKYSASFSSGLIGKKYSIYAKLSQILSSGYRLGSWVKFNSYHLSAIRYDDKLTTQVNFYGGPVADGLAYTGLPKFVVKNKDLRKANYSDWGEDPSTNNYTYTVQRRPEEIENFSQPHYELLNEYRFNDNVTLNSALFLVIGDGFFDFDGSWADTTYLRLTGEYGFHPVQNPGNVLIRAQVNNTQFGWIPRVSLKHSNGTLILGGEFRKHKSDHWGGINYGENLPPGLTKSYYYYFYNGGKDIINGFVHEEYDLNKKINLLGEIQVAYHKYRLYNEKYLGHDFSISNTFFNPRLGVNAKFSDIFNLYLSYARVSREPVLSAYYQADESSGGAVPRFQQNPDGSYNYNEPLVKPETMNDFEFGSSLQMQNISLTLNLFYMLFDNEIVKNGQVDRFGQPITGNTKRTVHTGVEFSGIINLFNGFQLIGNVTLSKNTIEEGNAFVTYNITGDSIASAEINLNGNRISGFPDFLTNFGISYSNSGIYLQLTGRYVGSFFSDNYDTRISEYLNLYPGFISYADNKNEAYFTADFTGSYEFKPFAALNNSKIFIQVINIFDNLYSAYAIGPEFFPAAERNFLAGIQVGL